MKSESILWIEDFFKNYALGPAIERARIGGPLYTSRDVWGKEVRCSKHIEGENWEVVSYKLHNYYAVVELTEGDVQDLTDYYGYDELIYMVEQEIRKQNIKMFGGDKFLDLPLPERNEYTCHQLCDWCWLIDDDGTILHERKGENGEAIYSAKLAKFAVVVDKDGNEVDKDD